MKKCAPRFTDRLITVIVAVLFAIAAIFTFCVQILGIRPQEVNERTFVLAGVFCGGLAVFLLYRLFALGDFGIRDDDKRIIFTLSRKDRREYRWDELQKVPVIFCNGNFRFPDQKRIGILPRMAGYSDFRKMLRQKGVQENKSVDFDNPNFDEIFSGMFGKKKG